MTTGPDANALTVRYVREELYSLRASMSEDVRSVRAAVDSLAADLRATLNAQAPKIAVLERRADDANTDIAELRAAAERVGELERRAAAVDRDIADLREKLATQARNRATWLITTSAGTVIAVISAVLAVATR